MLTQWWGQVLVIGIVLFGGTFLRVKGRLPRNVRPLDILLPFLIYWVHVLSKATIGYSILPWVGLLFSIYGICLTLIHARKHAQIIMIKFWVTYIRTADLVLALLYLSLVIDYLIKKG